MFITWLLTRKYINNNVDIMMMKIKLMISNNDGNDGALMFDPNIDHSLLDHLK